MMVTLFTRAAPGTPASSQSVFMSSLSNLTSTLVLVLSSQLFMTIVHLPHVVTLLSPVFTLKLYMIK